MQRTLTKLGLYKDKVDGKAGMLTRSALGAYQKANTSRSIAGRPRRCSATCRARPQPGETDGPRRQNKNPAGRARRVIRPNFTPGLNSKSYPPAYWQTATGRPRQPTTLPNRS